MNKNKNINKIIIMNEKNENININKNINKIANNENNIKIEREEEERKRIEEEKEKKFHDEVNSIINPENRLLKLKKELNDLDEEKKTIEEIIYYKELDKNKIYQIILKNKDNNLEIYINNFNDKPYSNFFSSFSLEILQKNNYFKLFNNVNSFLFEIKDLIDNSFINLETPGKDSNDSIFLYILTNLLTIDKIKFEIKKTEKNNEETIKDLNKYIEILEKEREYDKKIIKKLYNRAYKEKDLYKQQKILINKYFDENILKENEIKNIQNLKNQNINNLKEFIKNIDNIIDIKKQEDKEFINNFSLIKDKIINFLNKNEIKN